MIRREVPLLSPSPIVNRKGAVARYCAYLATVGRAMAPHRVGFAQSVRNRYVAGMTDEPLEPRLSGALARLEQATAALEQGVANATLTMQNNAGKDARHAALRREVSAVVAELDNLIGGAHG